MKVCAKRCDQCLFSENKIVSDRRRKQVLKECAQNDASFECHKATIKGKEVCCRGFYDSNPYTTNLMRIAARLNAVEFVEV